VLLGRLDKEDLSTKLGQLAHKIEEVKVEVHDALVKKYAEFYPLFDATIQLRSRVSDLNTDVDSAVAVIEKQVHVLSSLYCQRIRSQRGCVSEAINRASLGCVHVMDKSLMGQKGHLATVVHYTGANSRPLMFTTLSLLT